MKICYVCKEEKEESEFYWDDSAKTRLNSKCKSCSNKRKSDKRKSIPILRLIRGLKRRIRKEVSLYGFKKSHLSNEILGVDRDGLKLYFENRFRDGMEWDNYGTHWVVDHMLPMSEVETYEDLIRVSHYTNLQPLLVKENSVKSNKITTEGHIKKTFPYNEIRVEKDDDLIEIKIGGDRSIGIFGNKI
jgi:hypothetical protein